MDGTRKQDDLEPAVQELEGTERSDPPPTAPDAPGPGDAPGAGAVDDQDAEAPSAGSTLPPEGRVDDL